MFGSAPSGAVSSDSIAAESICQYVNYIEFFIGGRPGIRDGGAD